MLESGLSRNPMSSRVWKEIRVSLLKTLLLITPSLPNSPRRLTTRERLSLFNMRSSCKVSIKWSPFHQSINMANIWLDGLECGGAYLKLLRDNKALHQEEFSNASPYVIMFGPDKCGTTNKVHLIINHKNPKTGEYEEKHMTPAPAARILKTTELYTLIIHPNNTAIIKLDGEQVKEVNLLSDDFVPAFNPPKEIDDAKDTKPDTWVDEARIPDPEAKKPEDWDEEAPFEIVDEEATKPEDWLEDEPLVVPDPEAQKPEDWDDEEDGDWIAPTVPNPKCDDVSGCGKWEKPLIKNPAYKGKWTAPYIDNPAYKGVWAPRKIKNPDYFEDKTPSNLEPMGAVSNSCCCLQDMTLISI